MSEQAQQPKVEFDGIDALGEIEAERQRQAQIEGMRDFVGAPGSADPANADELPHAIEDTKHYLEGRPTGERADYSEAEDAKLRSDADLTVPEDEVEDLTELSTKDLVSRWAQGEVDQHDTTAIQDALQSRVKSDGHLDIVLSQKDKQKDAILTAREHAEESASATGEQEPDDVREAREKPIDELYRGLYGGKHPHVGELQAKLNELQQARKDGNLSDEEFAGAKKELDTTHIEHTLDHNAEQALTRSRMSDGAWDVTRDRIAAALPNKTQDGQEVSAEEHARGLDEGRIQERALLQDAGISLERDGEELTGAEIREKLAARQAEKARVAAEPTPKDPEATGKEPSIEARIAQHGLSADMLRKMHNQRNQLKETKGSRLEALKVGFDGYDTNPDKNGNVEHVNGAWEIFDKDGAPTQYAQAFVGWSQSGAYETAKLQHLNFAMERMHSDENAPKLEGDELLKWCADTLDTIDKATEMVTDSGFDPFSLPKQTPEQYAHEHLPEDKDDETEESDDKEMSSKEHRAKAKEHLRKATEKDRKKLFSRAKNLGRAALGLVSGPSDREERAREKIDNLDLRTNSDGEPRTSYREQREEVTQEGPRAWKDGANPDVKLGLLGIPREEKPSRIDNLDLRTNSDGEPRTSYSQLRDELAKEEPKPEEDARFQGVPLANERGKHAQR